MPSTSTPDREALRINLSPTLQFHCPGAGSKAPQWKSSRTHDAPVARALFSQSSWSAAWYQTSEPA